MHVLFLSFLAWNLAVVLVFGWDKAQARESGRHVPEKTLLTLAALFGAAGALVGMRVFRHKIRKWKFAAGVPLLLMLQTAIVYLVRARFH